MSYTLVTDDCRAALARMPEASVHCAITSPPYWGLRRYAGVSDGVWGGGADDCAHEWGDETAVSRTGYDAKVRWAHRPDGDEHTAGWRRHRVAKGAFCTRCGAWRGQLGLEPTPELYVEHMVEVMRAVRRVLRPDGVAWLNLGDSYASGGNGGGGSYMPERPGWGERAGLVGWRPPPPGLKPKDLVGIPWMVALALRADGWWLRSDVVWSKPNPMPESVQDRPTRSHEYLFLLSRSERYYYDAEAIRERDSGADHARRVLHRPEPSGGLLPPHNGIRTPTGRNGTGRNRRSVWTIPTRPYPGAHFATFPAGLVEPCVLAGTSERGCCTECGAPWRRVVEVSYANPGNRTTNGPRSIERRHETAGFAVRLEKRAKTTGWRAGCGCDAGVVPCTVLDPFAGSGTVGEVALRLGRRAVLVEASAEYAELARARCDAVPQSLFGGAT